MQINSISLGKPVTIPFLIPVLHRATPECISSPFMVDNECYYVTALSFGTPYGGVMVEDIEKAELPKIGQALSAHPLFPQGANIVFIQMLDEYNLKARLYARGVGEREYTPEAVGAAGAVPMLLQKTLEQEVNVQMGDKSFRVKWEGGIGEVSYVMDTISA